MTTEDDLKFIAGQLRHPHGEHAMEVVRKMNEGNRLINDAVLDVVGDNPGEILEIGMANGLLVSTLLGSNPQTTYTGCDISEEMVTEARRFNANYVDAGRAAFVHVEPGSLPQGIGVDTVFSVNTIYFWDDVDLFLEKIWSALRPGGTLVLGFRPASSMKHYPFVKFGFEMFDPSDVEAHLTKAGFELTDLVEAREPDREVLGEVIRVDHVVVAARRPKES